MSNTNQVKTVITTLVEDSRSNGEPPPIIAKKCDVSKECQQSKLEISTASLKPIFSSFKYTASKWCTSSTANGVSVESPKKAEDYHCASAERQWR